ncbi:DEAD/DEAH box helicase family protein [Clostridium folliculivorans]|uniref:DEAD/DEAH box helicase family protein n=1 Tax=Clostridium folliculivorans TaxID=2886038 RepID=UPI0021C28544|nr:DEAD/DEAH box helicase family protein [Clostridium folliculivorans]GKU29309.1 type III restriction endonuclease subunit R [Clostridium folliculivorans]
MPNSINTGTRDIPLKFAKKLKSIVNTEWEEGAFIKKVTPTTRMLLKYWFTEPFYSQRDINFHEGQRQAILNAIYVHEIAKSSSVLDMYKYIDRDILRELGENQIDNEKNDYPKYAIKMATGTGKTWVMHALVLWQYLNNKYEKSDTVRFSKNFLIVAPGLIVYERLLDSYLGKVNHFGERDFSTSDLKRYEELFIPNAYRNEVYGFVQNSTVQKEEIGRKTLGDGIIAITNWHLLQEDNEIDEEEDLYESIKGIIPITPGVTDGHLLQNLDDQYLRGNELQYLIDLKDIFVINDEAHHIHENKVAGEIYEVEWQKSLNSILKTKGKGYMQVDFSATPYNITGSGNKRTKHYFSHIIVDFDLKEAIQTGLVKTIVLDRRKEIGSKKLEDLDYKAIREGKKVVGLSEGQKVMIRAGLQKLKILEREFIEFTKGKDGTSNKYPKMLIMCEDTTVSPYIAKYLYNLGVEEEDIIQIDSNKQGEVKKEEWENIKRKLFNIDSYAKPRVIISVLMLREGFDVNNICVIVPLRASSAPILLEQTIGRGLRLMWREKEYKEIKNENRNRLLKEKKKPSNYLDILNIIEHPSFIQFYNELIQGDAVYESKETPKSKKDVLGDLIKVHLKEDYKKYDLCFPIIVQESEEIVVHKKININKMEPFRDFKLEYLKKLASRKRNEFYSEEFTVKTRFGNYVVSEDIFNAKSYNEYIYKIVRAISESLERVGKRKIKKFPLMQINVAELAEAVDKYIKNRIFEQEFNPLRNDNWRVLLMSNTGIIEHIIKELSKIIYELQNNIEINKAVVKHRYFSEIGDIRMREQYSVPVSKSIYDKLPYPVKSGGFEKDFIEYADTDSKVDSVIKILENYHYFVSLSYIRNDGLIASYFPDFILKIENNIYLVETKAQKDLNNENVKSKEQAALDWINKVNLLEPEQRMNCKWSYVLLGEKVFYSMKKDTGSIKEILDFIKVTKYEKDGNLLNSFD